MIKVVLEHKNAKLPRRHHASDIGADIFTPEDVLIPAGQKQIVKLGLRIKRPWQVDADILDASTGKFVDNLVRSYNEIVGLHHNELAGISVSRCVLDPLFEDELSILITNNSNTDFEVKAGNKIAQLITNWLIISNIVEF